MKTLKISFLQSTPDFGREGMLQLLKSRYHVVEDDSDFDYLVATPCFTSTGRLFTIFWNGPRHITVMYGCHEAIAPVSCCLTITSGSIRCPEATALSNSPTFATICRKCTAERKAWMPMLSWPPKRVSATSFTPTANPIPTGMPMFHKLSAFRFVNSLGPHLNNTPGDGHRAEDWYASSIRMKKPYKFSIAFENAWYPGYTSEKIVTSMLAAPFPFTGEIRTSAGNSIPPHSSTATTSQPWTTPRPM